MILISLNFHKYLVHCFNYKIKKLHLQRILSSKIYIFVESKQLKVLAIWVL